MRDILPENLIRQIRDRYLAGVSDAQAKFRFSADEEDSLTGALGQAISTAAPMIYQENGNSYLWQVTYQKLRGRGVGAPEKLFGADGIFEIEVFDAEGQPIRQKGLPFQAMKNWSKPRQKLLDQASDMLHAVGHGIVIDFEDDGYMALPAGAVIQAEGRASAMRESEQLRDLGHVLADDFLDCKIGSIGLHYDRENEVFRSGDGQVLAVRHAVETTVKKIPRTTRSF